MRVGVMEREKRLIGNDAFRQQLMEQVELSFVVVAIEKYEAQRGMVQVDTR
jgi:hypothetical protein